MKLEELLNKLYNITDSETLKNYIQGYLSKQCSLNDLCSMDSGLWQFVCGQALFNEDMKHREIKYYNEANGATFVVADYWDYKYRLMLSSIQPDKEKFLLDNIRID